MLKKFKGVLRDEEGATMVEYGLMVALIAVAAMGAVGLLGDSISGMFGDVQTEIDAAGSP